MNLQEILDKIALLSKDDNGLHINEVIYLSKYIGKLHGIAQGLLLAVRHGSEHTEKDLQEVQKFLDRLNK